MRRGRGFTGRGAGVPASRLFLKELYARSSDRSAGVGRALMAWVARHAVAHGCCRIDWPVKATNARGIAFYERLGAEPLAERLSYRLVEPGLSRLAAESGIERND